MQYYIIDSFIKKQASKEDDEGHASGAAGGSYERIAEDGSEDDEDPHQPRRRSGSIQLEDETDSKNVQSGKKVKGSADGEYDPEHDGDRTTVVGSGSSPMTGNVPKELLPKE